MGWNIFGKRKEILERSVGKIDVIMYYLDENNKVQITELYITGMAKYDNYEAGGVRVITAYDILYAEMEYSMKRGMFHFDQYLIPRERVLKMLTTYKEYWVLPT